MRLSDHQWEFLLDVSRLIQYSYGNGFKITGGDLYRSKEEQARLIAKGVSWTTNSRHLQRLAIDLNIFYNEHPEAETEERWKLIDRSDYKVAEPLGEFWESLSPYNVWGGYWTKKLDAPHFERRQTPRKIRVDE